MTQLSQTIMLPTLLLIAIWTQVGAVQIEQFSQNEIPDIAESPQARAAQTTYLAASKLLLASNFDGPGMSNFSYNLDSRYKLSQPHLLSSCGIEPRAGETNKHFLQRVRKIYAMLKDQGKSNVF